MARIRLVAVLAIALSAGGALAFGTYNYLQNVPVKTITVPSKKVVVAATDIQLGEAIGTDDVTTVEWPASAVPEGTFTNPADVVGRGLLAPIVRHEPFLEAKLAPRDSGTGLPPVIPMGMRAVSVRVNEVIGVAGYVLPGTRVDVITTATPTDNREDTTSKVVLHNVQVLAAGTKLEQKEEKDKPLQVTVVTLLVTPEQAERLALSAAEGKVQLALRNPLDQTEPTTPGVRPASLLGGQAPRSMAVVRAGAGPARPQPRPAANPAPDQAPTVEVIRGDKRANEVVK